MRTSSSKMTVMTTLKQDWESQKMTLDAPKYVCRMPLVMSATVKQIGQHWAMFNNKRCSEETKGHQHPFFHMT